MTKRKEPAALPEQFFYDVHFIKGGYTHVTSDHHQMEPDREDGARWLVFYNRNVEVFRYRVSGLAGWGRLAKPGVTA